MTEPNEQSLKELDEGYQARWAIISFVAVAALYWGGKTFFSRLPLIETFLFAANGTLLIACILGIRVVSRSRSS